MLRARLEATGFEVVLSPFGTSHFGDYKRWVDDVCEMAMNERPFQER